MSYGNHTDWSGPRATVGIPSSLVSILSEAHVRLWSALIAAHQLATVDNPSASRQIVIASYLGSGSMTQAVCAGLLSTGRRHAPLAAARQILSMAPAEVEELAATGEPVPGFGNSFFLSGDPAFFPVAEVLRADFPEWFERISTLRQAMITGGNRSPHGVRPAFAIGGRGEPNASLYTAAGCEILQVPHGAEMVLFIAPRIFLWMAEAVEVDHQESSR